MRPDDRFQQEGDVDGGAPYIAHGHEGHAVDSEDQAVPTSFQPGTGRRIKISAALVVAALLLGFLVVHFLRSADSRALTEASKATASRKAQVDVITVAATSTARPLTLPGETAAWYESTIYARVNGYVANWLVDIGDHVRQGQVLALIETPELDADLEASRAELSAAQAQVKVREAEADFARTTNERWRDAPKGVVSEQEREGKKADYDSAIAKLNAARAQVALDQARVDRFLAFARFKHVTAPYDGIITERRIDIGNLVTAGSTAGNTPLYRMSQDNPMRVFIDVPQSAAAELMKADGQVEVRAANAPNHVFSGKVARTANAINAQARTLRVEVDIPNPDRLLVPGMYVTVGFQLQSHDLLQVPAAALVFRANGPHIAVVDASGRVSFRKITIARDDGNVVELAAGVSAGDKVALNISSRINEGEQVSVNESAPAPAPASPAASATTALTAH
jgi:RND family efflux transporter MFP subunit